MHLGIAGSLKTMSGNGAWLDYPDMHRACNLHRPLSARPQKSKKHTQLPQIYIYFDSNYMWQHTAYDFFFLSPSFNDIRCSNSLCGKWKTHAKYAACFRIPWTTNDEWCFDVWCLNERRPRKFSRTMDLDTVHRQSDVRLTCGLKWIRTTLFVNSIFHTSWINPSD